MPNTVGGMLTTMQQLRGQLGLINNQYLIVKNTITKFIKRKVNNVYACLR